MPNEPTPTPVAATPPEEPRRPDPLAAAVAEGVVRLRREAGLSERAAARKLGTSQTQLRRMEDPRYLPSLRSLQRVALAYGYKLSVAFEREDTAPKRAAPAKEPKPKRAVARGSASPSKGRRVSPGRGRGGGRRAPRRTAQRRRARSG
ncbi:MAG: helix-turn-helix transcriptional regulator [Chloroflexi bacterium]|nr:MAG: helix-turn-helix transcriptional regulator [Chloroflexota bacterium]